jgi:hypothetical protein
MRQKDYRINTVIVIVSVFSHEDCDYKYGVFIMWRCLTFSVRHLNAIKSTAGRSFLGIKPLPALQQM